MNKNRLEAFSDGVIAIIITIMVLEIKVPHTPDWSALYDLLPVIISYIISFLFVGIYWVNHHHLLHTAKKISSGIMWSNLMLLFFLSLVPIATAWMGENEFSSNTVASYGVLALLCGSSYTTLQWQIKKNNHQNETIKKAFSNMFIKGIWSIVFYSTSIVVAFFVPILSAVLFVTVSLMWLIPDKNIELAFKE